MKPIRLLIADDHTVMRIGLRKMFDRFADISVVAEACNGVEALKLIDEVNPDVILLDMHMPIMDGVEVALRLKETKSRVRILAFSAFDDKYYIISLLEMGAAGYLTKDEDPRTIVNAVRGVARGETGWLSPRLATRYNIDTPA